MVERGAYSRLEVAALAAAGFASKIVSGSGTDTHSIDLELRLFTEHQVGSYVFMDRQYRDCDLAEGGADNPPFENALTVDARVVGANHDGLVTIDAGFKALATDGDPAEVREGPAAFARFAFMGDECRADCPRHRRAATPRRRGESDRAALRPEGEPL
jgi:3-hydroxy-D-aspartate aldolase